MTPDASSDRCLPERRERRRVRVAAGVLSAAVILAYLNSFSGAFVLDDFGSIVDNPTIRHLWRLPEVLSPPQGVGETVSGRPLLNLSFALNYAVGGTAVMSYHAVNLTLHLAAGLLLLGVVRRTWVRLAASAERTAGVSGQAALAAGAVALIWALHPLQTESVTYIVQRAESLVGLCYLATLYGFIRGATGERRWLIVSWMACLAGMASKEVMVSAPLIVWLYDRTFIAGSFREAWRQRGRYYLALGATWGLLALLVAGNLDRAATGRLGGEITPWSYALTQCDAIVHYLRLVFWPGPLVFDYGHATVAGFSAVAIQALGLGALLAGTVVALVRWPAIGFLGAWFFAILAPSSSFVPVATQTMAEHRMYLPLAAVVAGAVWVAQHFAGRRGLAGLAVVAVGLGGLTVQRNRAYQSPLALWADTVEHRPGNIRARSNLAVVLIQHGKFEEAAVQAEAAVRLDPRFVQAHLNLAQALAGLGRRAEALARLREARRIVPESAEVHHALGRALTGDASQRAEGIAELRRAVALRPAFPEALSNLGLALAEDGATTEAVPLLEKAVALRPEFFEAHNNLGIALARGGRAMEALACFAHAAALNPREPGVEENWGNALMLLGNKDAAEVHFRRARELRARR